MPGPKNFKQKELSGSLDINYIEHPRTQLVQEQAGCLDIWELQIAAAPGQRCRQILACG